MGGVIDVWKYVPFQPDVSYFQPSEITIFSLNPFSPKAAATTTEGLQQTCEWCSTRAGKEMKEKETEGKTVISRRQIRRQVTERRRERNVDSCIFFFLTFGFREHKHILSLHTGPKLHQIWTIVAMVLDKSGLVGSRITSLDCKVVLSSLYFALVCSPTLFTSIYFKIFNIFIYVCRIFISLDCRVMLSSKI